MSVRVEISGFNLSQMMSLAGSRDQELLKKLSLYTQERSFWEPDDELDAEEQDTDPILIVERVVSIGVPFAVLDVETPNYVDVAEILSGFEQKHLGTDSNIWGARSLWQLAQSPPYPDAAPLLEYIAAGRPVFGRRIEASPWSYGYLSNAEVRTLRKYLPEPAPYEVGPPVSEKATGFVECLEHNDFPACLASWLKAIDEANLDLWISQR